MIERVSRVRAHLRPARDERDQPLEELLVAAAHGGDATMAVIDVWLVDLADREFLGDLE